MLFLSGMLGFLASPAGADSFAEKCAEVQSCAKAVSTLTGQKYVFDGDVKTSFHATPNVELTQENAELLFTKMLYSSGYTRLPLGPQGTYEIERQRDARDSALPVFAADERHKPELPATWDLVTMKYKATHPESIEQIARLIRSFMPASARVIPTDLSGMLVLTAAGPELARIYDTIRENDQKPTAEMLKEWKEAREQRQAQAKKEH
jgi:hypothetical protein